jgi:hypothetical protein
LCFTLDVLERYRHRGLRTPFTLELMEQIGVPPGAAHRTLQALRLLDLIDESGQPTEALEALKRVSEDEYPARFADMLRSGYHDVFAVVDPARDSPTAVRDAFRYYRPDKQQDRMVTLFLALCEEGGIIDKGPRRRGRAKVPEGTTRRDASRPARGSPDGAPPQRAVPVPVSPANGHPSADPAVTGVLARLPSSQRWSPRERERWLRALEAAVDLLIDLDESAEVSPRAD